MAQYLIHCIGLPCIFHDHCVLKLLHIRFLYKIHGRKLMHRPVPQGSGAAFYADVALVGSVQNIMANFHDGSHWVVGD